MFLVDFFGYDVSVGEESQLYLATLIGRPADELADELVIGFEFSLKEITSVHKQIHKLMIFEQWCLKL